MRFGWYVHAAILYYIYHTWPRNLVTKFWKGYERKGPLHVVDEDLLQLQTQKTKTSSPGPPLSPSLDFTSPDTRDVMSSSPKCPTYPTLKLVHVTISVPKMLLPLSLFIYLFIFAAPVDHLPSKSSDTISPAFCKQKQTNKQKKKKRSFWEISFRK